MAVEQANIKSVDDFPADRRRGGEVRAFLTPKTIGATTGFMGLAAIDPGDWISEHYHPYSEEFVYVVSGALVAQLDGAEQHLGARQGMVIPINARHRLLNQGQERAEFIFHLCPLAPRPDMGHVDTEERGDPGSPPPAAGAERPA